MPNTLTNVKDIKVAQSALQPFMAALLPMRAFSTNFSPEPADKLDTVRVPVVGAPSPASELPLRRLCRVRSAFGLGAAALRIRGQLYNGR